MAIKVPKGKFISSTKVGEKGQIVIPKELRDMFDIKSGDSIIILGDVNQGIALMPYTQFEDKIPNVNILADNEGDNNGK